eukprot:12135150-Alexandrium_andersonii.AAC.1
MATSSTKAGVGDWLAEKAATMTRSMAKRQRKGLMGSVHAVAGEGRSTNARAIRQGANGLSLLGERR